MASHLFRRCDWYMNEVMESQDEACSDARAKRTLILAVPRGFCAGVERAVNIIDSVLRKVEPPIYCLNEIVHNRQVVADLVERGVVFVRNVQDVPRGGILLFSAHGVSPTVRDAARERDLRVVDATCPFVEKVHREVRKYAEQDYTIVLIGKRLHDEIIGVAGEAPQHVTVIENEDDARTLEVKDPSRVAVVTQTTLGEADTQRVMEVLRSRFPELDTPAKSDICYATHNRQQAVRVLAGRADLVLVLGSINSSNSNRLVEVAKSCGTEARLVPDMATLESIPLRDVSVLGLTAGASVPEQYINETIGILRSRRFSEVETAAVATECVSFRIPDDLL